MATVGLGLMTIEGTIGSISRGDLLTLVLCRSFAAHIVTLGHFSERMGFELLSVAQVGAAAVLGLALFWWVGDTRTSQWRPVVICGDTDHRACWRLRWRSPFRHGRSSTPPPLVRL